MKKTDTVLEIGTGSGYMAALAYRAAKVLSLEIDDTIAARAAETLRRNGVHNAEVRCADWSSRCPAARPS